jgi:hypothetical protein
MICACCGKELVVVGKQEWPAKYNIPDYDLVECQNEGCIAHRRTSSTKSHAQICEDARREQEGKSA